MDAACSSLVSLLIYKEVTLRMKGPKKVTFKVAEHSISVINPVISMQFYLFLPVHFFGKNESHDCRLNDALPLSVCLLKKKKLQVKIFGKS